VQIWDAQERVSEIGEPSWWEMGLLNPTDWTAQWLAIETPIDKADREAGLHWIWGEPSRQPCTRRFRLRFQLPTASLGGEFLAVTNDWGQFAQITGVWLDGEPISGPTVYTSDWTRGVVTESDTVRRSLAPMSAGEHVLAVEVGTGTLWPSLAAADHVHAVTWFARLNLSSGETLRLGSGSNVNTSLVSDSNWHTPLYDDKAWQPAQAARVRHQPWPPQPAMHLRREFLVEQPILQARLYATALGAYEARLNGNRIGDALLTPEISQYAKRVLYRVYDVTTNLRPGRNALGLTVGDGWYASFDDRYAWGLPPRRALAQLELLLADGSRQTIATTSDWRIAESAIRESQIRVGEIYDARLEQPGWDVAGFDDAQWRSVDIADTPPCRRVAQVSPPIRATQVLTPQGISQPKPGIYLLDFGQHFAGWCRLQVKGPKGTRVEVQYAELLTPSGELDQSYSSMGRPKRDIYILRGDAAGESFAPHFTYRGMRYVQISGLPAPPTPESVKGVFVHSDLPVSGDLRSDSVLLTQLWRNVLQTQRSNFVGVQTDNPSREQRGHLMDAGLFLDAAAFNMDVASFVSRHMDDVVDDQLPAGAFPGQAPEPYSNNALFNQVGAPGAAHAGIAFPWMLWQRYGDLAIIERHWGAMNQHMKFILAHNPNYVWKNNRGPEPGWGDHVDQSASDTSHPPPSTPTDLIATAYWAHAADLLARMAQAIGRTTEANQLRVLHERIRRAFQETFVSTDGVIGEDSQTAYVLALKFGLLEETTQRSAQKRLADDIRRRNGSLSTGILGTQFVLDVLADAGLTDLVFDLLLKTEFPSWGHMIQNGATTIWETWNGGKAPLFSARNQPALGSIGGFLFRRVIGIDTGAPGFESIVVRPIFDSRVKRCSAYYDSVLGRIACSWQQTPDATLVLKITIPANTEAHIHLPARRSDEILETEKQIERSAVIRVLNRLDNEVVLAVGSGTYQFSVNSQQAPTHSTS
jgi:alpha-L-rhamnosidase